MIRVAFPRITLLLICCTMMLGSAYGEVLRVGYVSGGLYEQFVNQKLANLAVDNIQFQFVSTQGSREQMELLEAGSIDLAIVQSDIAYYAYEGAGDYEQYSDFSLALPLFEEYLQVLVRADSDIYTLGRLLSGTVSVGQRGSGAYQNATDLFSELDFRPGIDFQLRHLSIGRGLEELKDAAIDGVFYTGGIFPATDNLRGSDFRVLAIPDIVIEAMAMRSPYYTKASYQPGSTANESAVNTVAVPALFVASNDVSATALASIINALTKTGSSFQPKESGVIHLRSPESAIEQAPIPLHDGLRIYLREQGHVGRDYSVALVFFIVSGLIGFVAIVQIRMRTYDRMGNLTASKGTATYTLYQLIAKSGTALIVLFIFFLLVVGFVEAIQFFEDDYARRLNVRNPFADRGFWSSLLWVITFMGAGDPGDVFPNSSAGKFLASLLPFLGVGAVLGFGYSAMEQRRERQTREREGTLSRSISDHVLICGWNEKAPGIIYTLTSSDVPRKRHVIVVANMDEKTPLDQYGFDLRYVSYCKGDSANHKVLERANASHADVAVVLGGVKKRAGRNIKSVLSVLALRKLAQKSQKRDRDIMLIAELMFSENEKLFKACGANAIVSSEAITHRVAAMSCISPLVVDFVLDMLTYDDHCELYALPLTLAAELVNSSSGSKPTFTLGAVANTLLPLGINVVASNNTEFADPPFLDHIFTGQKFSLLLDAGDMKLKKHHELLIIADDFKDVKKKAKKKYVVKKESEDHKLTYDLPEPRCKRIILVGDPERCVRIARELEGFAPAIVTILTTHEPTAPLPNLIVGDYTEEDVWRDAGLVEADQVTILARSHREVNASTTLDPNELDAEALLIANFANMYAKNLRARDAQGVVTIAAEMLSATNQKLFEDAGVDTVIPTNRILERVISKLIYSRGAATRFLMALLRFDGGKHFMTFEIVNPPPKTSFSDLVASMPNYFQLLGVLPSDENQRQNWVNEVGDFRYHFLTTPVQATTSQYQAESGDTIIGIIDQEQWLKQNEAPH